MFFEFLGALPVCFCFFLGAKMVSGVMCNHKSSLKSISKAKTSIFTFFVAHFRFGENIIFGTGNSQEGGFEHISRKKQLNIYLNVAARR